MTELLTRKDAAAYLETKGVRPSQSTLARYAMGGFGPQYALIGCKPTAGRNGLTRGWKNNSLLTATR